MSQALTLARPYARAAFSTARRTRTASPAGRSALGFAAQVAADPRAASLLLNPQLTHAEAVSLLSVDGGERVVRALPRHCWRRTAAWRCCRRSPALYEELRAEAERVVKATVTSAATLPAAELDALEGRAEEALRPRSRTRARRSTPSLIGGAVIDAGDVVIDGSLKGKLARLQAALAQ